VVALISALLTFAGTMLVAGLGFWQWRRTQTNERQEEYRARRVGALGEVWAALSNIEEAQRQEIMHGAESLYAEHVRSVNLLLLRLAPFLETDEREWAVAIVQHIVEIDSMLRSLSERGLSGAGWWLHSIAQPSEASVAAVAATGLRSASKAFGDRYAAVLKGDHA
jgi:hypothetical protein